MKRLFSLLILPVLLMACGEDPAQDNEPPKITLKISQSGPKDPHPEQLTLDVAATDDVEVRLLKLERSDDARKTYTLLKTVNTAPFAFQYVDTLKTSGTYIYRVTAEDASGKMRETEQAEVLTLPKAP